MTICKIKILVFCLILFSCRNKQSNTYSDLILGDWAYIEENKASDSLNTVFTQNIKEGYLFLPNNICQNKLGYFRQVTTKLPGLEKAIGVRTEETKRYFLGTETKFEIEDDSLKIFNLSDSSWQGMKIQNINSDTLVLQNADKTLAKYSKKNYQIDNNLLFDEIVVSSSGCLGFCPITNIIINQSGKAIYFGEKYTTRDGLYTFSLTKDEYNQVVSNFNKADIKNLNENYEASWTDDVLISLTFLKNDKIIKEISDYGNVAPTELYWAYMPLINMYQLKQLDTINSIPTGLDQINDIVFSFQLHLGLSRSQAFYFWNLLREAKETKGDFSIKYELTFHGSDKTKKVQTDGRFYRFIMADGSEKILDIGFDFINRNSLSKNLKNNENVKVF